MTVVPQTFFDALATMDVSGRFESLTCEERAILARYHEVCAKLGVASFFAGPVRLSVKAAPDESYERLEHPGEDQLRSMTMWFRQLWMKKEPARFHAVLGLLRGRLAPNHPDVNATRTVLTHLGRRHRQACRRSLMKHVWDHDPVGEPIRDFDAEQVIDDWLYGGQFHFDPAAAERVGSWSRPAYEWSLIKAITGVCAVCWELDLLVGAVLEDARQSSAAA